MSADPVVPDPMNGQAWNRYSYVINNPLALTDPNGYCFLGMCTWGKAISTFFDRTFGVLFRKVVSGAAAPPRQRLRSALRRPRA